MHEVSKVHPEERCWAYDSDNDTCSGALHWSEDQPGFYSCFCDAHGHYEDWHRDHPGEPFPLDRK